MGEFMLTVLGGVATLERHLIKARTDTGIKRARAAGIKFGRPNALTKHQQEEALKLLAEGKLQSEWRGCSTSVRLRFQGWLRARLHNVCLSPLKLAWR